MRVLALDYGSARTGVAVSDFTGTLATPRDPVLKANTRKGIDRLATIVRETEAVRVVVGLPLSLSGGDTDQTVEARAFADRLAAKLGDAVPVELYDERFTTTLAQRSFGDRASEDSRAAAILLEEWLAVRGPDHLT